MDHIQVYKANIKKVQSVELTDHIDSFRSHCLGKTMKLISNNKKSKDLKIKTYRLNNSCCGSKENWWSEAPDFHELKQLVKNLWWYEDWRACKKRVYCWIWNCFYFFSIFWIKRTLLIQYPSVSHDWPCLGHMSITEPIPLAREMRSDWPAWVGIYLFVMKIGVRVCVHRTHA